MIIEDWISQNQNLSIPFLDREKKKKYIMEKKSGKERNKERKKERKKGRIKQTKNKEERKEKKEKRRKKKKELKSGYCEIRL